MSQAQTSKENDGVASPRFSLIITTVGRVDDIVAFLNLLLTQTLHDLEVIIVEQSDDVKLENTLKDLTCPFPVRYIRMSQRGASRGRNAGMEAARGEIITFPDDDCLYDDPHLLQKTLDYLNTHPDVDVVIGRTHGDKGIDNRMGRFGDQGYQVSRDNLLNIAIEYSMFFRHEVISKVRYDEDLGVGAGTPWGADEGPDLVLQLLEKGAKVVYNPDFSIYHPDRISQYDEKALRRSYTYACGRGRLLRKHAYPFRMLLHSSGRSLAGSLVYLLRGRLPESKYYWLAFRGKWRGWLS